jgi:glutathione synthase/RimK-type ligase-like ATP-grasp enzyme
MEDRSAVLLLGSPHDPHVAAVAWALGVNGVGSLSAPSIPFGEDFRLSISMGDGGEHLHMSGLSVENLRSVWVRRPRQPSPAFGMPADRKYLDDEWGRVQKNLFALTDSFTRALWINAPEAAIRGENKLLQLHVAREAGLSVPETLVSNDAAQARRFIARHGTVVFKTFGMHMWRNRSEDTYHSAGVTLLDANSDIPDDALALCPGIFQPFVRKRCDVRATVVGDRIFAIKLSKGLDDAYVDWRINTREDDFHAEPFDLPEGVERRLRVMMRELGLVFGCVDMVADEDGNLVFLEVNQSGQFLFVERLCPEVRVLQGLVAMLARGRVDYTFNDSMPVTLEAFLATDDSKLSFEAMEQAMPVLSVAAIEG